MNQQRGKNVSNSKQVGTFEFSSKENNQYQKVQASNIKTYQPVENKAKSYQPVEVKKITNDTEKKPVGSKVENVTSNVVVEKLTVTSSTTTTNSQA